jgi:hypothetical protein
VVFGEVYQVFIPSSESPQPLLHGLNRYARWPLGPRDPSPGPLSSGR